MSNNSNGTWILIAICALGYIGYMHFIKEEIKPVVASPPSVGRYEIVKMNEARAFLIDTSTGDTWQYVHLTDKNGVQLSNGSFWSIEKRFTKQYEEDNWNIEQFRLHELQKTLNKPK